MALSPPLGPRPPSEAHTPLPGKPDIAGCTGCPASGMEMIRSEQKLGLDSLDAPEHLRGGQRGTEPTAGPPRLSMPSSHEDSAEDKHHEHPVSGLEVLEAEQDSLHLCLLGLGLRLQDLERGLGPWTLAQSMTVRLQALQADLRGAAERVDALLAFGEGLAQRSEPRAWASLEQILRALGAHRDTIFRRLWQLQTQLVSYSLVFEEANMPDQDLEAKGDSDGPGSGGVWGPWAPSSLLTPAELEWDPAGDVGGLGPLRQRTTWTPGAPCELCGHRGPQGRGQGFENRSSLTPLPRSWSFSSHNSLCGCFSKNRLPLPHHRTCSRRVSATRNTCQVTEDVPCSRSLRTRRGKQLPVCWKWILECRLLHPGGLRSSSFSSSSSCSWWVPHCSCPRQEAPAALTLDWPGHPTWC